MMDLRAYRSSTARLSDYLPWAALVAPGIVLNKDGAFQRTLAFRGPDLDSSARAELQGTAARLNNALRRLGAGWCLHVEARRGPVHDYPPSDWPEALSWLVDEERRAICEAAGARYESRYFLTLSWLAPVERQGRLENLLFEGDQTKGAARVDYTAQLRKFEHETDQFMALIELEMSLAHWLDDEETLTYLHDCISDRSHRVARPATPFHLDALLSDCDLVGGLAPRLGGTHLRIISVRGFVTETEPGLLDALNRLPIAYRWVQRFMPLDREDGRRELEKIRKRWFSKRKGLLTLLREALFREEALLLDNDAANQAEDSDAALQALGAEAVGAGYATLTLVVQDSDEAAAEEAVRQIRQITDAMGFVTQVESVNAVEAWLGGLPGQAYADARRPILLTSNLAHLLPLSAVWAGSARNAHLQAPPLMINATEGATPFRLNLHVGDVGHTLIVGPTGAGKSVLLGCLAAQWRRYRDAQVFIFDKGRSCRALVLGLGGVFWDLGEDESLGLQPLADIDQDETRVWAQQWVLALAARAGVAPEPDHRAEIWRALELLGQRPRQDRTMTLLAALIQDRRLRTALEPFTHEGAFGRLFDRDETQLPQASVHAFEMEALMRQGDAAPAALGYIFHALERRFDGRPTLLILDEAWLFLKDAMFATQIQDWLKTLRKRNVAVIFASQELADV
ncbi:MAG TPA: conjugal transfer protein TrbE, partial [Verrucomicrobiae bacterium]|nr:conjugal transfer protein TrbE [Verrucomicrobiae bacterium]